MTTLQELCIKRKNQITNRNGTEALIKRIDAMQELAEPSRSIAALKLKGYIEALFDNQLMSFTDANDWLRIVESKTTQGGLH